MDIAPAFRVSGPAAQRILDDAARSGASGLALRVAARQEADGSVSYGMGFDEIGSDEEPMHFDGLAVLVAGGCEPLLQGTVLDYVELEPGSFCFVFIPPQSAAQDPPAPGCGSGGCSACGGR